MLPLDRHQRNVWDRRPDKPKGSDEHPLLDYVCRTITLDILCNSYRDKGIEQKQRACNVEQAELYDSMTVERVGLLFINI